MRRFAHVEGNWSVHVFAALAPPGPSASQGAAREALAPLLAEATALLRPGGAEGAVAAMAPSAYNTVGLEWRAQDAGALHLSFSHTAPLREYEVEPFLRLLRERVAARRGASGAGGGAGRGAGRGAGGRAGEPGGAAAEGLRVRLRGIEFYRNDDATRSFAALGVTDPDGEEGGGDEKEAADRSEPACFGAYSAIVDAVNGAPARAVA